MKKTLLLLLMTGVGIFANAQSPNGTFYTIGNKIFDPYGNQFSPRGVNYSVLDDWDFPGNGGIADQVQQSHANTVRLEWYNDYGAPGRPAYALSDLDNLITDFKNYGIVSVVELHDVTGHSNSAEFQTRIIDWWTNAAVVTMMNAHKDHVILNIANEYGPLSYEAGYAANLITWKNDIIAAITQIRAAGLQMPIMIDAPSWGLDHNALIAASGDLYAADPLNNLIFSVHAYWSDINAATVKNNIAQLENQPYAFLLGEVAYYDAACDNNILLEEVMKNCEDLDIGWLAWTWTDDNCLPRRLTTDGNFANLTASGATIVNNANWGLNAIAEKTDYAASNFATPTISANQEFMAIPYYDDQQIRFFRTTDGQLQHYLNIGPDVAALGGGGPNMVLINNDKMFVSVDVDIANGGILIYQYEDIFPAHIAAPVQTINTTGTQAIAIHPATEDLYVATYNNGISSARIARYTAASNYNPASVTYLPVPGGWINYMSGLAFDADNNLYTCDLEGHRLLVYTAASGYNSYYVVVNLAAGYEAQITTGGTQVVQLFSAPEGLVVDNDGNVWIGNNNDWTKTNNPGDGTIARISNAFFSMLLGEPVSGTGGTLGTTYSVLEAQVNIYLQKGAKFGGMALLADHQTLVINDQGTDQGNNWQTNGMIWKFDISNLAGTLNPRLKQTNLHSTYPGYGGMSFNNINFPLPIALLEFSANIKDERTVALNWTTSRDQDVAYFEIEKSTNGKDFTPIGIVNAMQHAAANYTYDDNQAIAKDLYYRLKMISESGKFTYSPIKHLTRSAQQFHINIAPNPVKNTLYITGLNEKTPYAIYDLQGSVRAKGAAMEQIEVADLSAGIYLLKIGNQTLKFVKE